MFQAEYLMESDEETLRLDLKTEGKLVQEQALWAGIKPGMRVADLGCGPGKTTYYLSQLVEPKGEAVGVDFSDSRIQHAISHYQRPNIRHECLDIRQPMDHLGQFDFVWVRFVLEYYKNNSFEILNNIINVLKPGGILCLVDLDYNCLTHFELPQKLENTLLMISKVVEENFNFDPFVGRKLYSYIYDLGLKDIEVKMDVHHLIYGKLNGVDEFNWIKKLDIVKEKMNLFFRDYPGGFDKFKSDFTRFFNDPRRFTYTPLVMCRGKKS